MGSLGKFAASLALILAVGVGVIWWEAKPKDPTHSYPEGSLGQHVSEFCDPVLPLGSRKISDGLVCRDLAAQESMAISTAYLFWLSWAQLLIGLGGTIAVVWTVLLAVNSNRVTQQALRHQQTAARMQLRPTFVASPVVVAPFGSDRARASFLNRNCGASTARVFRHGWVWAVVPNSNQLQLDPEKARLKQTASEVPKDGMAGFHIRLSKQKKEGLAAGSHVLQMAYVAAFDDELGGRYVYRMCREYWGADLAHSKALKGFDYRDPYLKGRER